MKPEDLRFFSERLDIMKRWALSERVQLQNGRPEHAPDVKASEPCPSSACEVNDVTVFAASRFVGRRCRISGRHCNASPRTQT
ncbi:MAG: hypothetical protein EOP82_01235 [Variovorax sp.]|nr:MAG: hypothetical protein EOP82_01235 [Variovorax sp.]